MCIRDSSLGMSDDASVLVIGSLAGDPGGFNQPPNNAGRVQTYLWNSSTYVARSAIEGTNVNANLGANLALSSEGTVLAVVPKQGQMDGDMVCLYGTVL